MKEYTITELSEILEVHPQIIRNLEYSNLMEFKRDKKNIRYFIESDLEKIKKILFLLSNGYNKKSLFLALKNKSLKKLVEQIKNSDIL